MTTKSEKLKNLAAIQEQIERLKEVQSSLTRSYSKDLKLTAVARKPKEDYYSSDGERAAEVELSNSDAKEVVAAIIALKEAEYDRLFVQVLGAPINKAVKAADERELWG